MKLLAELLADDPSTPRVTYYDETTGARIDFSATTLENWVAKIAHFLHDELDLTAGDTILLDLPASWQAACIALGAYACNITVAIAPTYNASAVDDNAAAADRNLEAAEVLFTSLGNNWTDFDGDIVIVSNDPFGRGVTEIGEQLPPATLDFGPTVRFYPDTYTATTPTLEQFADPTVSLHARVLTTGWTNWEELTRAVLTPLARQGSIVIVHGLTSAERLKHIASIEKVTHHQS
ncbi:TIGR03089 family protein [Corynebacterium sp. HS2168-gen11]|uniref:TIGR03089 family protein n=1 Tax=Corynebacterium sp. HS2168-gen11 TaxID=2974027 RepID=UPI00216B159A|nr:TIGR03089 family protein [Corynebacterium sp. HS2168-gen11]MCS4535856.1 TIGR03089 family protein [Corynebacterium sp. HS2168-gen11]